MESLNKVKETICDWVKEWCFVSLELHAFVRWQDLFFEGTLKPNIPYFTLQIVLKILKCSQTSTRNTNKMWDIFHITNSGEIFVGQIGCKCFNLNRERLICSWIYL